MGNCIQPKSISQTPHEHQQTEFNEIEIEIEMTRLLYYREMLQEHQRILQVLQEEADDIMKRLVDIKCL